ncbi:MAG: hypothetical protein SCK70_06235 [bacterium]|nr:hypothetical protein [bacterium]
MSIIDKLATSQGTKSDVLNQMLAKELADNNDRDGIRVIVENLENKNRSFQSDCIKVLYEIGYIKPVLITEYVEEFIKLLKSRNNRLVWGSMIALSVISELKAKEIFEQRNIIIKAIEDGSVITSDAGIKTLSGVASHNEKYNKELFPYLIKCLMNCRPKSVPQYSESIFPAVSEKNEKQFIKAVNERKGILSSSQIKRVDNLLKELGNA